MFGSGAVAGDGFMIKGGRPRLPFFVRVAVEGEFKASEGVHSKLFLFLYKLTTYSY